MAVGVRVVWRGFRGSIRIRANAPGSSRHLGRKNVKVLSCSGILATPLCGQAFNRGTDYAVDRGVVRNLI